MSSRQLFFLPFLLPFLSLPTASLGSAIVADFGPPVSALQNATGLSIAIGADARVAATGSATQYNGIVSVYERRGYTNGEGVYMSGAWLPTQTLVAMVPDGVAGCAPGPCHHESIPLEFGYSVAVGGRDSDWIAVGAPGSRRKFDPAQPARTNVGRIFVYHRDSTLPNPSWVLNEVFESGVDSNGLAAGLRFGACVAMSGGNGDHLAAGLPGYDGGKGKVILFNRIAKKWSKFAEAKASDGTAGAHFGFSIALGTHGDTMTQFAIGAPDATLLILKSDGSVDKTLTRCGKVYIFARSGFSINQEIILKRDEGDGEVDMQYGYSVALGNSEARLLVVGAPGASRAYVIRKGKSGAWSTEDGALGLAPIDGEGCVGSTCVKSFGSAVAIASIDNVVQTTTSAGVKAKDGNYIIVGAPSATIYTAGGVKTPGQVYPFVYGDWDPVAATRWGKGTTPLYRSAENGDFFGRTIAVAQEGPSDGALHIVFGAPGFDSGAGRAFGYTVARSFDDWSTVSPTNAPSYSPTIAPTHAPSIAPTAKPSSSPSIAPTAAPTITPTHAPTAGPTVTALSPAQIWIASAAAIGCCCCLAASFCVISLITACLVVVPIGCRREQGRRERDHIKEMDAAITSAQKQSEFEMAWFKKPAQYAKTKGMRIKSLRVRSPRNGGLNVRTQEDEGGAVAPPLFSPLRLLSPSGMKGAVNRFFRRGGDPAGEGSSAQPPLTPRTGALEALKGFHAETDGGGGKSVHSVNPMMRLGGGRPQQSPRRLHPSSRSLRLG